MFGYLNFFVAAALGKFSDVVSFVENETNDDEQKKSLTGSLVKACMLNLYMDLYILDRDFS